MARKAILESGKRDEIIAAATQLFFTEGFEGTSVRKILGMVGGEQHHAGEARWPRVVHHERGRLVIGGAGTSA